MTVHTAKMLRQTKIKLMNHQMDCLRAQLMQKSLTLMQMTTAGCTDIADPSFTRKDIIMKVQREALVGQAWQEPGTQWLEPDPGTGSEASPDSH